MSLKKVKDDPILIDSKKLTEKNIDNVVKWAKRINPNVKKGFDKNNNLIVLIPNNYIKSDVIICNLYDYIIYNPFKNTGIDLFVCTNSDYLNAYRKNFEGFKKITSVIRFLLELEPIPKNKLNEKIFTEKLMELYLTMSTYE